MFDTSPQALTERILELRGELDAALSSLAESVRASEALEAQHRERVAELERETDACIYSAQKYQGERDTTLERVRALEAGLQAVFNALIDVGMEDSCSVAVEHARTLLADATPAAPVPTFRVRDLIALSKGEVQAISPVEPAPPVAVQGAGETAEQAFERGFDAAIEVIARDLRVAQLTCTDRDERITFGTAREIAIGASMPDFAPTQPTGKRTDGSINHAPKLAKALRLLLYEKPLCDVLYATTALADYDAAMSVDTDAGEESK